MLRFELVSEVSFGMFYGKKLVGEAVLHRFGYRGEDETFIYYYKTASM